MSVIVLVNVNGWQLMHRDGILVARHWSLILSFPYNAAL